MCVCEWMSVKEPKRSLLLLDPPNADRSACLFSAGPAADLCCNQLQLQGTAREIIVRDSVSFTDTSNRAAKEQTQAHDGTHLRFNCFSHSPSRSSFSAIWLLPPVFVASHLALLLTGSSLFCPSLSLFFSIFFFCPLQWIALGLFGQINQSIFSLLLTY